MDDLKIIEEFFSRSENAIENLSSKYGGYCKRIALNILKNNEDAEECLNDTLLKVWNSVPPEKPLSLMAYSGKIVRNLALDMFERKCAQKRGGGNIFLALDEFSELLGNDDDPLRRIELNEVNKIIDDFLGTLSDEKRNIFVFRYWYLDSLESISEKLCISQSKVKSCLFRLRKELKKVLTEKGVEI